MDVAKRVTMVVIGLALIVLGFANFHVQVAAIVVGLVLIGVLGGDELARLLRAARGGNGRALTEGTDPPDVSPPKA